MVEILPNEKIVAAGEPHPQPQYQTVTKSQIELPML
jgi:hypothetical protein